MTNEKDDELLEDGTGDILSSMEDVLATADTEYRTFKAWGGKPARIGSLTAGQMITFLENNDDQTKKRRNGMMLIALSLVDKTGKRLVDANNAESVNKTIESLKTKDSNANGKVVERILTLNGLNAKDAKEIAKNVSGEAQNGASQ
jgi:hypothetical protein